MINQVHTMVWVLFRTIPIPSCRPSFTQIINQDWFSHVSFIFILKLSLTLLGAATVQVPNMIPFKQERQRCMLTGLLWTTEKLTICLPVMESYLTMKVHVEVWNKSRPSSVLCIGLPVKPAKSIMTFLVLSWSTFMQSWASSGFTLCLLSGSHFSSLLLNVAKKGQAEISLYLLVWSPKWINVR